MTNIRKHIRRIFLCHLFYIGVNLSANGQPAFSQISSYKMVLNPALTAITDTIMQKDTSKEITILYKDKSNPQSYKYFMGTFQLPITNINSGAGVMVNYNTVNYYLPGLFENPFGTNPYGFINPNQVNTYYSEFASKLYYRHTFKKTLSAGIDIGEINYNFSFYAPGTNYVIHPNTIYADVGILNKGPHWLWGLSLGYDFISSSNLPFAIFNKGFPNYSPFAYNGLLEYRADYKSMQLDIIAYSAYVISSFQATVYLKHILLVGASVSTTRNIINILTGSYVFTGGNYIMASTPTFYSLDYYPTVMIGVNLLNNKLKITFSYDIFPKSSPNDTGPFTSQKQNMETSINDRFN